MAGIFCFGGKPAGSSMTLRGKSVEIVREVDACRAMIARLRAAGGPVALVPTMGALHAGHMSLITRARAMGAKVAASIFVNPKQFGPQEDFGRYPRQEASDRELLDLAGCDLLFAPAPDTIYPPGFATNIAVGTIGDTLEGAHRPGHFDGVTTVVCKLFNIIQPDIALFGEKDWQQLAIIRRMTTDLDLPIKIVGVPTMRDRDGLALSSRNNYLSTAERTAAAALPQALLRAAAAIRGGESPDRILAAESTRLIDAGFASMDYFTLADAQTLVPLPILDRPARLLIAARIGTTRLIDNIAVSAP